MSKCEGSCSDLNSSNDDITSDDEHSKSKRKDTPTYTHIPARRKMLFQGQGKEGTISLSVEEVDEYAEENEQPEQDCQAEASKIRVVETSFDKPRKSSFRVKKGMRREVSVQICDEPDIVTKGDTNSPDDNDEEDNKGDSSELTE